MKQKLNKVNWTLVFVLILGLKCGAQIQYGTIVENEFHFSSASEKIILNCHFGDTSIYKTETTSYNFSFFPYCWKKINEGYGVISGFGYDTDIFRYRFSTYPQNSLDSISQVEKYQFLVDSIAPLVGGSLNAKIWYHLNEVKKIIKERKFFPLYEWLSDYSQLGPNRFFKEALIYTSFDFIELSSEKYLIFLRNKNELTIWDYLFNLNLEDNNTAWSERITYSQATEPFLPFLVLPNSILPKGDKHIYQAISDSLFFVGEYKVIRQDSANFIINTSHGAIYYLAPESIVKVGQIRDFDNYPSQWFVKTDDALFVEDQDRGELIFFKEVDQINTDYPFPKIVVLPDKAAARNRFGNLIRP